MKGILSRSRSEATVAVQVERIFDLFDEVLVNSQCREAYTALKEERDGGRHTTTSERRDACHRIGGDHDEDYRAKRSNGRSE